MSARLLLIKNGLIRRYAFLALIVDDRHRCELASISIIFKLFQFHLTRTLTGSKQVKFLFSDVFLVVVAKYLPTGLFFGEWFNSLGPVDVAEFFQKYAFVDLEFLLLSDKIIRF